MHVQINANRCVDDNRRQRVNSLSDSKHINYFTSTCSSDRKQYFLSLLAAKFNRQNLDGIAKAWGRNASDARQDFIHIQKLYDGMVMYMERYVATLIP